MSAKLLPNVWDGLSSIEESIVELDDELTIEELKFFMVEFGLLPLGVLGFLFSMTWPIIFFPSDDICQFVGFKKNQEN
jgi:hypothetical protein